MYCRDFPEKSVGPIRAPETKILFCAETTRNFLREIGKIWQIYSDLDFLDFI